jgi:5-methylcytosine-specific restriction endonuclease McrA
MPKSLLLNNDYQILQFISERKALKLFVKDKVDVISEWHDEEIVFASGKRMKFPAVLRLKYYVHKKFSHLPFSRRAVFKRDKYICMYCGHHLKTGNATVDHIIPKVLGGVSSFINCVASCFRCNTKKGARTPEEAGMFPINKPVAPNGFVYYLSDNDRWHDDWNIFLKLSL